MNTTTWNIPELEAQLRHTRSFAKTAKHYGVSRERIRVIATKYIGKARLREIGVKLRS